MLIIQLQLTQVTRKVSIGGLEIKCTFWKAHSHAQQAITHTWMRQRLSFEISWHMQWYYNWTSLSCSCNDSIIQNSLGDSWAGFRCDSLLVHQSGLMYNAFCFQRGHHGSLPMINGNKTTATKLKKNEVVYQAAVLGIHVKNALLRFQLFGTIFSCYCL